MNSVLDDLENVEDLNELESRLYGQIHHEVQIHRDMLIPSETQCEQQSVQFNRVVTNTSVINNVESKLSNRYWNNSQNTQQVVKHKKWTNISKNDIEINKTDNEISKLKENTFKPFKAYESIITNLVDNKIDNLNPVTKQNELCSEDPNPKQCAQNKSDISKKIDKNQPDVQKKNVITNSKKCVKPRKQKQRNLQNQNNDALTNLNSNEHIQKNLKYKNTAGGLEKDEPLVRNFLKMKRALKMQAKRTKAKMARQRNAKRSEKSELVTFDLITDDDEDDDDDVVVIPVPPPPIVTINDDSSDSEDVLNHEESKSNTSGTDVTFAKPKSVKTLNRIAANINDSNSSGSASPSSVVSGDDFIGHADRSRLLQERIIVNDDDLICIADNIENYIENQQESHPNFDNSSSQLHTNNSKTPLKINDYRGTQDVYFESESDIPESICSNIITTGDNTIQSYTKAKGNIIIEESPKTNSDYNNTNNATQKIKRLRKRRASSSNKEIETNNNSTDSEREEVITNEMNTSKTTLPYITRGEAVETCKIKQLKKRRSSQSNRVDFNSSDNEFINMLHTFSQGKSQSKKIISLEEVSDESTISEEDLTARKIAEEILNKQGDKYKQSTNREEHSNYDNLKTAVPITMEICNKENACDIPIGDIELMERQFNIIDKMPTYETNSDHDRIETNFTDIISTDKDNNNSDNIYNISNINSNNIGWNEEMFRFYNCSWGGENFNVNSIRKKMDRKARWTIYTDDRFTKFKRHSNIRCNNCAELGHIQAKCPQPKKPLMCSMCGQTGHREPRCPNTICLRCGNKTRVFIKSCNACMSQDRLICPICKIQGHGIDLCPDKWRRYHSTINNGQPNSTIVYSRKIYCCICAGRGHLSEHCKVAYRFSEYPPTVTQIKSHRKSYDDQKKPTTLLPNSYNLLYEPDDSINFSFSTDSKITTKQYYGRFLNAVGLNYIINPVDQNKRKLPINSDNETEKPKEKNRKILNNKNNRKSQDIYKNIKHQYKNLVCNPLAIHEKSLINEDKNRTDEISIQDCIEELNTSSKNNESEEFGSNPVIYEHKFKSPNNLIEKSTIALSDQTELNKCDEDSQILKDGLNLNMDSDSNYSFSEHFDINNAASTSTNTNVLPDFIPLNDDKDDNFDDNVIVNSENLKKLSTDINLHSDDDTTEFESTFQLPDIPCIAKIYLKKDFSDYLLSPDGNKFIVDNSNKFDVKASIDWTRVGNILVLEGLRANQDKFHTELLLAFRSLPDKLNRKELENNQQVPRKRIKMIRFLIDNLRILLKSNLLSTDVNLLLKQLKDYENKNSQTSWKMAEKTRRILNMTLFGYIGLRNGKKNLELLVNYLKSSLVSEEELISNEMREDINKSWKYIFSQKHENYEELVEIFYEMKRKNLLPKLKIDERLFYSNFLLLTDKEKNEIISDNNYYVYNFKQSKQYNSNTMNNSTANSTTISKLIFDKSKPMISKDISNISLNISETKSVNVNQSFGEFLSEKLSSRKLEWENQCIKLLKQIENCTKNSSNFWSKHSIKFINSCIFFYKSNQLLSVQLQKILEKANKGLLSYNDHRDILKIYNNSKIFENS